MEIFFWGTRSGSVPGLGAQQTRKKVLQALQAAQGVSFEGPGDLEAFVDKVLPFCISKSYGYHTSCVQIAGTGVEYLFCDAGSGLAAFSQKYAVANAEKIHSEKTEPKVFHFYLSHLHWDHIQGFLSFLPAYIPGNTLMIHTHHTQAREALGSLFNENSFPLRLEDLKANIVFDIMPVGRPTQLPGLRVESILQDHPGGSYGYRFESAGRSVVYSTDAEHREGAVLPGYPFVEFFKKADVLIFDSQYSFVDAVLSKANWGHSNNITAVELASRAQVKHLVLFHNEAEASDEELDQFLFNTRLYADIYQGETVFQSHTSPEEISLAYDGLHIRL